MKKIMFNDKYGLTKAVLEGRKTQTRCMLNPTMLFQRLNTYEGRSNEDIRAWKRSCNRRLYEAQGDMLQQMLDYALSSSHYKVGEEVALAQKYSELEYDVDWVRRSINKEHAGWNNKMFVSADLMPHRIRITDIRIERLQDIKHHWTDVLCEGVMLDMDAPVGEQFYIKKDGVKEFFLYATDAFASLIDKTCGKGTWDSNPYVFVYDFELIK